MQFRPVHDISTLYSWVDKGKLQLGRLEQVFLLKEAQLLELPHIPQLYSWVDRSIVGKALVQGNDNNKQHHPGIEPESSGSQANPKPLLLLLLLLLHINN